MDFDPLKEVKDTEIEEAITDLMDGGLPEEPVEPVEPEETPAPEAQEEDPEVNRGSYFDQLQDVNREVNPSTGWLDTTMDVLTAPGAGMNDTFVDLANKIPGVNFRKEPKYENQTIQGIRELFAVIAPFVALRQTGVAGGQALNRTVAHPLGQSKAVQWIGTAGVDVGAGALVDSVVEQNEVNDNLFGFFKKNWPQTYQWYPSDWATSDADSPDLKKQKNINEGIGLGMVGNVTEGLIKLYRGIKGTRNVTEYVFESDSAQRAYERTLKKGDDLDIQDSIAAGVQRQEEALNELGELELSRNPNPDKPTIGVHDVFDDIEQGVRTVDNMGVVGASVDLVRINGNIGTSQGRLGSIVSESALKYGLEADKLEKRVIVEMIKDEIRNSGKYDAMIPNGVTVTFKQIDEAGTRLAEYLMDPMADPGWLKSMLSQFQDIKTRGSEVIPNLSDVGYNAAIKATKGYLDQLVNLEQLKASAYFQTSLGGQVSDLATGARMMDDTEAMYRAYDQIIDRVTYLMTETGIGSKIRGQSLNLLNTYKRNPKAAASIQAAAEDAALSVDQIKKEAAERAAVFAENLREVMVERPEFMKPLALAWELSDGDINSMAKLNRFIEHSLPRIQKAIYDDAPEIPNMIYRGAMGTIYNSMLSAGGTILKGVTGNVGGMLLKPVAHMGGALRHGDLAEFRRGWHTYSAVMDSFMKGTKHMAKVFTMASKDPSSVSYIIREDMATANKAQLRIAQEFAKAASKRGEDGPQFLVDMAEGLIEIGEMPMLRFGPNGLTAMDGFSRAVMANSRARMLGYDQYIAGNKTMTKADLRALEEDIYKQMFDETGLIRDDWVDYANAEIALNLDTPNVRSFTNLLNRFTFLKPFIFFPKTSANVVARFGDLNPIPGVNKFIDDYAKIVENVPMRGFTQDELNEIMLPRGLKPTPEEFNGLQRELQGRKMVGAAAVMSAVGLWMKGRLHGNGHYDKTRQKFRRQNKWQPKSIQGEDGNWYSYEWLGSVGDWLAFTADVLDNSIGTVTPTETQHVLARLMFLFGASITNRSMMAGLEPFFDVSRGDGSATSRWLASTTSAMAPLSGWRNEMGKLLSPGLDEIKNNYFDQMRNRNRGLDLIDPEGAAPAKYDWYEGGEVGFSENPFIRFMNATGAMKIQEGPISDDRQFLLDIEYDATPTFNKGEYGIEYTNDERSALFAEMGQNKVFKREVIRIMNSRMGKDTARTWREEVKRLRREGNTIDETQFANLYNELDTALNEARKIAVTNLIEDPVTEEIGRSIKTREYQAAENLRKQRLGEAPPYNLQTMTNR